MGTDNRRTTNLNVISGRAMLVTLLVVGGVLFGLGYGLWQLMQQVPLTTARAWALIATVAVPVVGWKCYHIGTDRADTRLQGIDYGIETVSKAATQAATQIAQAGAESASLRGQTAATIRRATQTVEPVIELPRLDGHYEVLGALPSGEEVEI